MNEMDDDVLDVFAEEWRERKRLAAQMEADDPTPYIERQGRTYVLVRSHAETRTVTVRFSPEEWAVIRSEVLGERGLMFLPPIQREER